MKQWQKNTNKKDNGVNKAALESGKLSAREERKAKLRIKLAEETLAEIESAKARRQSAAPAPMSVDASNNQVSQNQNFYQDYASPLDGADRRSAWG